MRLEKSSLLSGITSAGPIALGYFPYAFAFGILAREVGLSLFETVLMCLLVYAGASQIVVMGLIQAGQGLSAIVLTTFFINVRYFLMATALAPYVARWSLPKRLFFGYQISDETFAVHSSKFSEGSVDGVYAYAVNITAYLAWALFSAFGFLASGFIPNTKALGLDFALPAVFIGLLLSLLKNRLMIFVTFFSSLLTLVFHMLDLKDSALLLTAIIGATIGAVIESWEKKSTVLSS